MCNHRRPLSTLLDAKSRDSSATAGPLMAKAKKTKPPKKIEIVDEPGAEERFKAMVKQAVTTPPQRKKPSEVAVERRPRRKKGL